jgi:hypothetical protein
VTKRCIAVTKCRIAVSARCITVMRTAPGLQAQIPGLGRHGNMLK